MSDPGKYRTKEEVEKMRGERDPIERLKKRMTDSKAIDEAQLKAMDAEVRRIVADAAEYATTSPEPDPKELWTDVLVESKPAQAA